MTLSLHAEKSEQDRRLWSKREIRGIKRFMIVAEQRPGLKARIESVRPLAGVHAGSALVYYEGRLLVVQDDAASVVWIDIASGQTKLLVLEGTGEQLEKKHKPDFEVAFLGPGKEVTVLGSGSSPQRRRRVVIDLETGVVRNFDEGLLFEALEKALGVVPNLEGGAIWRNRLRLFHRGAGADRSAVVDVHLDVLQGKPAEILELSVVDLGAVGGVPLHFTDATICNERLLYLAVAEDTPNAIDDGPVVGAALGFLEAGRAYWTPLLESSNEISIRKVEGIAIDSRSGTVYGVTDPDDPDKHAEILTIVVSQAD